MPTFDSFKGGPNPYDVEERKARVSGMVSSANFLPKVFGVMFIGLLFTALIAGGLGYLIYSLAINADEAALDSLTTGFFVGLIICAIGLIVLSIVIPVMCARGKHSILIPFILYILFMGGLLSVFALYMNPWILAEAAGITALAFGVISLIGLASKGRIPGIGLVILGLLIGIVALSLVNLIMYLMGQPSESIYWIVEFAFLALIMFVAIYDVRRINQIADKTAEHDNNTVLYCAFIMYSDVINLFIRIVYILSKFRRK